MAGAGEIQHIFKIANLNNCYFWRSHQAKFCQGKKKCFFFLIWHGAHRCLVNAVLAPLNHIQHRHIFWTFPLIHFSHKSPIDFNNSVEILGFFFIFFFSPNIGERSTKCVWPTLKVGFSLQFWVFRRRFAILGKKKTSLQPAVGVWFLPFSKNVDFKIDDTSN